MRSKMTVATGGVAVLAALYLLACSSSSSPTMPTTPAPPGGGGGGGATVTISIVGQNGAQSFSPNPASVTAGQTVAWVNNDSVTHRVVQDGGAFDTGNLAPGATSSAIVLNAAGAMPYHCAIHPTMTGTVNVAAATGPGY